MGLAIQPAETLAIARRLFETFSSGGMEAIAEMLHPDVEAQPSIPGAPAIHGRAALVDFWAEVARRGTEVEARPLGYELHGSAVIVRGYLRHRDGRTLAENQVFWLYEIREGLITRMESHPSRKAALAALGE
jgi:ketosteroid isomerase-like protein